MKLIDLSTMQFQWKTMDFFSFEYNIKIPVFILFSLLSYDRILFVCSVFFSMCINAELRLFWTGTPLQNTLLELLGFVTQSIAKKYRKFVQKNEAD